MNDEEPRDGQDPEGTADRRPVGPSSRRVRFITAAMLIAVVVLVAYVVVATVVLR